MYFNSRPHEEVDEEEITITYEDAISTHDLTKRSTVNELDGEVIAENFNSRPHEEVDEMQEEGLKLLLFQLTTSRRGRRY